MGLSRFDIRDTGNSGLRTQNKQNKKHNTEKLKNTESTKLTRGGRERQAVLVSYKTPTIIFIVKSGKKACLRKRENNIYQQYRYF